MVKRELIFMESMQFMDMESDAVLCAVRCFFYGKRELIFMESMQFMDTESDAVLCAVRSFFLQFNVK